MRVPVEGARIRLRTPMSIEGRIVGPKGDPVPKAQVWFRRIDEEGLDWEETGRGDGTFVLSRLPPGSYGLRAESRDANLVSTGQEVVVEAGAKDVTIPTREGFRFRARVVLPDGSAASSEDCSIVVEETVDGNTRLDQWHQLEKGLVLLAGLGKCVLRIHVLREGEFFDLENPTPGTVFGPFEVPGPDRIISLGR